MSNDRNSPLKNGKPLKTNGFSGNHWGRNPDGCSSYLGSILVKKAPSMLISKHNEFVADW